MQIVVDGLLTTYESHGNGTVVLLIHGWGDTHKTFSSLMQRLGSSYTVIALDLPGFGGTQSPPNPWTLHDYARFIRSFCQKLSVRPKVIVGHSNGGAIAIRAVASQMLSADKLVLVASSGVRGEYEGRNKALRLIAKTGKFVAAPLPSSVKRNLRRKVYATVGSDMLVAEHLQETFKHIVADDIREDAKKISCPTLLVYGSNDTATPVAWGQKIHQQISGSRMEIINGVGHFVHHESADKVNALIEEFIG